MTETNLHFASPLTVADLRRELGLTQEEFALRLGLSSKGQVSAIESGGRAPSLAVAVEIEKLSAGRIDAALLNADVAVARGVGETVHAAPDTRTATPPSSGKADDFAGDFAGRVAA